MKFTATLLCLECSWLVAGVVSNPVAFGSAIVATVKLLRDSGESRGDDPVNIIVDDREANTTREENGFMETVADLTLKVKDLKYLMSLSPSTDCSYCQLAEPAPGFAWENSINRYFHLFLSLSTTYFTLSMRLNLTAHFALTISVVTFGTG